MSHMGTLQSESESKFTQHIIVKKPLVRLMC